ncbi:unnamed protein product, partial [Phaeothamnion confervicola]
MVSADIPTAEHVRAERRNRVDSPTCAPQGWHSDGGGTFGSAGTAVRHWTGSSTPGLPCWSPPVDPSTAAFPVATAAAATSPSAPAHPAAGMQPARACGSPNWGGDGAEQQAHWFQADDAGGSAATAAVGAASAGSAPGAGAAGSGLGLRIYPHHVPVPTSADYSPFRHGLPQALSHGRDAKAANAAAGGGGGGYGLPADGGDGRDEACAAGGGAVQLRLIVHDVCVRWRLFGGWDWPAPAPPQASAPARPVYSGSHTYEDGAGDGGSRGAGSSRAVRVSAVGGKHDRSDVAASAGADGDDGGAYAGTLRRAALLEGLLENYAEG